MSTQAGGSANLYGVSYQMLWSLLEASELVVESFDLRPSGMDQAAGWLVVEPSGGGGDVQVFKRGQAVVQQLKAKSDGGTWSFRSFVEEVLPDLYRAADRYPDATYQLVTEGRMGLWEDAKEFLEYFGKSGPLPDDTNALDLLDDNKPVKFAGSLENEKPEDGKPTSKVLFTQIVNVLKQHAPANAESDDTIQRKLWRLLGHLDYQWKQGLEEVRDKLRQRISASVNLQEFTDEKLDAMLGRLQSLAAKGEHRIDALKFWRDSGLRGIPLSRWDLIRAEAELNVAKRTQDRGYRNSEDVRPQWFEGVLGSWHDGSKPFLVLAGESGQGKTWFLASLAEYLVKDVPCVFFPAPQSGDITREQAEKVLGNEVIGLDLAIPFGNLAQRVKDAGSELPNPWLYIFIDGIRSIEQARSVYSAFGSVDGIRVAFTAPSSAAKLAIEDTFDRAIPVAVPDFSLAEAKRYVADDDFYRWEKLDPEIRSTIRRPLLANLFVKLGKDGYLPKHEYELYDAYFQRRILNPLKVSQPFAEGCFTKLGLAAWDVQSYTWSSLSTVEAGLRVEDVLNLVGLGWLVEDLDGSYRVWHDRLLSWLMAWSLTMELCAGNRDAATTASELIRLFRTHRLPADRIRDYVALDLFWLLANHGTQGLSVLDGIFAVIEEDWMLVQELYSENLPTLGRSIVPLLVRRLDRAGGVNRWLIIQSISKGLAKIPGSETEPALLDLLDHESDETRNAASSVFRMRPTATALPKLWQRYLFAISMEEEERDSRGENVRDWWVEGLTHRQALYRCGPLDGDWIEQTISDLCIQGEPLACLTGIVPRLGDGMQRWQRVKSSLRNRLVDQERTAFTDNIFAWRDAEEIDWLYDEIRSTKHFRAPLALRALTRIDLDQAFARLADLGSDLIRSSRQWVVRPLAALSKESLRARIAEMMINAPEQQWEYVVAVQDQPSVLSLDSFESLLDDLVTRMRGGAP